MVKRKRGTVTERSRRGLAEVGSSSDPGRAVLEPEAEGFVPVVEGAAVVQPMGSRMSPVVVEGEPLGSSPEVRPVDEVEELLAREDLRSEAELEAEAVEHLEEYPDDGEVEP